MIKILHVDGDSDYLRTAIDKLVRLGPDFVIDTAENSAEAMAKLAKTSYDIILTDYRLPFSNGIDLVRTIRESDREIPIFLLSSEISEEILLEALRVGANDYFVKSALPDFAELSAAIYTAVRIRHHRMREQSLILARQAIAEGTSLSSGKEFFNALLKFVALSLEVNFTLIGELSADSKSINTISVWGFGHQIDNFSFPITGSVSEAVIGKKTCVFPKNVLEKYPQDRTLQEMGVNSYIGCPLFDHSGIPIGIIAAMDNKPIDRPERSSSLVTAISTRASVELERYIAGQSLADNHDLSKGRIREKKRSITAPSLHFGRSIKDLFEQSYLDRLKIVLTESESRQIKNLLESAGKIAHTDLSVLITGEKGTFKDLLAAYIHIHSHRSANQFVFVECSESASMHLEKELFGTDDSKDTGLLKNTRGGTVFFSNIHSLDFKLQTRLVDYINISGIRNKRIDLLRMPDIRIIASTEKSLPDLVARREFDEDLFQELKDINLRMPSLKERLEDIPTLISFFLEIFHQAHPDSPESVSDEVITVFSEYDWPSNMLQLESVVNFAASICGGETIEIKDIPHQLLIEKRESEKEVMILSLRELERRAILKTIEHFGGNKSKAARSLGISDRKLFYKLKEYEEESD